jgi:biotin operon repressor
VRQSDIWKILLSGEPVPDGEIFEGSTCSAPAVKLSRLKKKLEREGEHTIKRIQCYRLPQCELAAGLEHSPVLIQCATVLNGSTALSKDQLAAQVWNYAASENDIWDAIYRLRDDWGLPVVSTGYRQMTVQEGKP